MSPSPNLEQQLLSEQYRIDPEAFWQLSQLRGDDGYDRMQAAQRRGWQPVPSWGRDGWDLGTWPLIVICHRHTPDGFQLAYDVEGDITIYRYPTRELRDSATDCLALWHWKHQNENWANGIDTIDTAPDCLCGPFSWQRLRRDQPTAPD